MAQVWKGAEVSAALHAGLAERIVALRSRGVKPCLAIVRVGANDGDLAYERNAVKRCEGVGVRVQSMALPADVSGQALLDAIRAVNADPLIHGCLLLRPLPAHIDDDAVLNALSPDKDVDGVTDRSLAGVFANAPKGFPPCTAAACMQLLDHFGVDPAGKRAVVVGRSLVVGRPVAMLLMHRNATVTLCHTRTARLDEVCREADILVVAAGRPGFIGAHECRPGQIVIDAGIHVNDQGKLVGDVAFAQIEPIVAAITPVPGGVGGVTTSVLAHHVVLAAERMQR